VLWRLPPQSRVLSPRDLLYFVVDHISYMRAL
jgi:hypothetical protein